MTKGTLTVEWQALIMGEIADRKMTRDVVAETYAILIAKCHAEGLTAVDWPAINRAILSRWSPYALDYIKAKAWKRVERGWAEVAT